MILPLIYRMPYAAHYIAIKNVRDTIAASECMCCVCVWALHLTLFKANSRWRAHAHAFGCGCAHSTRCVVISNNGIFILFHVVVYLFFMPFVTRPFFFLLRAVLHHTHTHTLTLCLSLNLYSIALFVFTVSRNVFTRFYGHLIWNDIFSHLTSFRNGTLVAAFRIVCD